MPAIALANDIASAAGNIVICKLLVIAGMAKSNGEARRLVTQGGVELHGEKVTDPDAEFPLASLNNAVLKVGARRYVRLLSSDE